LSMLSSCGICSLDDGRVALQEVIERCLLPPVRWVRTAVRVESR
jgi:hypothetical protein